MGQHPQLAYDLLEPIVYLRESLNIPYCHHEKWDGSGYPRGLSDTQIPLEARLFALADVWDALTSDRPYRTGWPRKKALEHIREQSEKHFDPQMVELFLQEIGDS
jgi:putative two-component system response regulator